MDLIGESTGTTIIICKHATALRQHDRHAAHAHVAECTGRTALVDRLDLGGEVVEVGRKLVARLQLDIQPALLIKSLSLYNERKVCRAPRWGENDHRQFVLGAPGMVRPVHEHQWHCCCGAPQDIAPFDFDQLSLPDVPARSFAAAISDAKSFFGLARQSSVNGGLISGHRRCGILDVLGRRRAASKVIAVNSFFLPPSECNCCADEKHCKEASLTL